MVIIMNRYICLLPNLWQRGALAVTEQVPTGYWLESIMSAIFIYHHIVNTVCCSHAVVCRPTSKRPASDGGLCSGQLLVMWSAVCSGSPHSHCYSPYARIFQREAATAL